MSTVLARHIGHRVTVRSASELRCLDCTHTILIPPPASTSTSQSPIPGKDEPRCPLHLGEHESTCRCCAADRKASITETRDALPMTADVPARAAEVRAQLSQRTRRGATP